MDIEEEVEEIEDEIKKPDEGQVAERELNYRRHPEAEDLDAPDVFAGFRKETLPIFSSKFSNPFKKRKPKKIGNITWEDDIKTIADHIKEQKEQENKPEYGLDEKHRMDHPDTSEYSFYKSMINFYSEIKKLDPDKTYDPDEEEDIESGKYTGAKPSSRETGMGSGIFPSKWKPKRMRGRVRAEHPDASASPMSFKKPAASGAMGALTTPKPQKKKKPKVAQSFQSGRRQAINQAMAVLTKDIYDQEDEKRIKDKPKLIPAKDSGKKTPAPKRINVKEEGGKLTGDKVETAKPKKGKPAKRLFGKIPFWAENVLFNLTSGKKDYIGKVPKSPKPDKKTGKSKYKPKKRNIKGKMPKGYNRPSLQGEDWQGKVKSIWVDIIAI